MQATSVAHVTCTSSWTPPRILQRQQFTLVPQELSELPSEEKTCPQEALSLGNGLLPSTNLQSCHQAQGLLSIF